VARVTVNRLSPPTAAKVLEETLPFEGKPVQLFAADQTIRSIHGTSYTRLYSHDLVRAILDAAGGQFAPPPVGFNGGTGLYAGEEDCFVFLVDRDYGLEVGGQEFWPGLVAWNSEIGRRTVGLETFYFQRVCANHIIWGAANVVRNVWKHTAKVAGALDEIQRAVAGLRDHHRDGAGVFAEVVKKSMGMEVARDADGAAEFLVKQGIFKKLADGVGSYLTAQQRAFTLFNLVDALTAANRGLLFAGARTEADQKASSLLTLAA
jgi:hypothetical protein